MVEKILINGKAFDAFKIDFAAPLLIVKGSKGFLCCGYFSLEALNRLGDAAAIVKGVKNFDEMLEAKVAAVSEKAKSLGATEGMTGREALLLLS